MSTMVRNAVLLVLCGAGALVLGAFLVYTGGYEGVVRGRLPGFDGKWRRYYSRSRRASRIGGLFLMVVGIVLWTMGIIILRFIVRQMFRPQ